MNEQYQGTSSFRKMQYQEQIAVIETACRWLGIASGRARDYQRLIKEFWEEGPRTQEHMFVHHESCEILDLYELWNARADDFPGLQAKIAAAVSGGPVLTENEEPNASSNRPRNDAFVYLLAGELIQAGLNVLAVDGIVRRDATCHTGGDITFDWERARVDIQCKRPQTEKAIVPRIREARRQIEAAGGQIVGGIIAIDCSAFIRPAGKLIERASSDEAGAVYSKLLERWKPIVEQELRPTILGYYLHARAPAMILVRESPVLSMSGKAFQEFRPDSIRPSIIIANKECHAPDIVPAIHDRLRAAISEGDTR